MLNNLKLWLYDWFVRANVEKALANANKLQEAQHLELCEHITEYLGWRIKVELLPNGAINSAVRALIVEQLVAIMKQALSQIDSPEELE